MKIPSAKKRGFAFLPILIILASVLIGTGSVLLLREKMNEEQGTRDKEQEGISKFQETNDPPTGRAGKQTANSNESNSLKQSNDETSAENLTLKSSNENNTNDNISYDETNSSESQEIISKQIASSNDVNNDSLYLKADNDGKDKLHLGNTLKIKGGDGIKTSLENNTITVTNTGNTSPSSTVTVTESSDYDFDANQFSVSDNDVSIKDIYVKRTDGALVAGSNISLLTNNSGYITDGNTNWDNTYGFITDGNTGWDNTYGFITASSSDAFTNKTGNISMWTNNSGYITGSSSSALTNKTGNISMWTNDAGYITDGNTNWDNTYRFITDGNTGWDNSYNFITASSSDALTNKTGNISMWTNDANFITLSSLSSSATGLTYTNTTGAFSLTSGYVIPTTTQETNWGTAYTNRVDTWNYPLSISSNAVSLGCNTTNLKITSNQLNTIQDIATTSSPTFTNTTLSNNLIVAGKVGIGTTDLQKKLEINDNDADTTTSGLRFGNFVCNSSEKLTVDANGDIICATDQTGSGTGNIIDTLADTLAAGNNANALNITNIGRLYTAIGLVGTPSFSFQSDQDTGMYSSGTDTLNFTTGGSERMRIGSTGNIGIGTTDSGTKLDVNGSIRTNNQLVSTVATGTAPLSVTSTTKVANLNAEQVDGYDFNQDLQSTSSPTFAGLTLNGTLALGASSLTTSNTTVVTNLNADLLDGQHSSYFLNTGTSFGGDISGTYGSITVADNSHAHDTTTISGLDISSDTNLSGDTEIVLTDDALSIASSITRDTEWNTISKIETATSSNIVTSGENISLLVNDSAYITDGNTGWDNSYGFITDGNTSWDNSYGYITASSSDALTNKTGNISMWTNDANFITLSSLSSSATGLTYTNTTGSFSLTSGYIIPTTTQETNWGTAYSNTHSQNTDSGTTQTTYQIDSDATGPKLKNNTQVLEVRNAGDTDYANLKVKDLDIEGILQAGTSNIQLTDTTGKIQALSSTYFASLSGSNLTSLNASNISSGTIPSAQVSGSYTGITGVGTITTGTWSGTEIGVTKGGTGLTTISSGKLLYSSALNTLSELTLDTTLDISAGYLGVNETNILLSLLGGTLDDSQLPSGGDWTLTTNLNIDSNTLYIDQSTNRIGIGTTAPATELDVNGTVKTKNILMTNETSAPSQEEGKVYYDANDKQFKLYNSQNDSFTDLAQDPHIAPSYCPDGYIPVPGDIRYGTNTGFCVAKYEMKCALNASPTVGLTTPDTGYHTYSNSTTACTTDRAPKSLASGYPIANITQTTAETYCSNLGTGYSLITNNEWMTIARNIEKIPANWTGGTVGSGGIWRGHTDGTPNTAFEAYSDDTDPYYQTGNTAPSIEKRTFTLSSGENIWDLSGNVWEWNRDTIRRKHEPHSSSASNTWNWYELTSIDNYGKLSYATTRPSKPTWNATQNMGGIYTYSPSGDTDETVYAFLRGGGWGNSSSAGLFALNLNSTPGDSNGQRRWVSVCVPSVVS